METKEEKYLSIITNFGCHFTCPYCIVKNNHIDVPVTTLEGLDGLEEAVKETGATIISVSGGGDPLHNYTKHMDWWKKLFLLCYEMEIPLEVHTSYFHVDEFPYYLINRMVYHCHTIDDFTRVKRYYDEKVRVVFVVDETFDEKKIRHIGMFVYYEISSHIDELSFRQMVDKNYETKYYCHDYLKKYHNDLWYYIEQNDYNTYYVNGKLYTKFSDIGKENENEQRNSM